MTMTATKTDAQIKADVLGELKWHSSVKETEVGVQVKDGVVTLTGSISAYPRKVAAIDAAHRVFGVLDVVDDMKVAIPTPWVRSDQEIAGAVRTALKWDVLVPEERITTTVAHGLVTLEGTVDTWMQRHDAECAVSRLTGVKGVINYITIAGKTVEPALIRQEIEAAIERRSEREAKRIGVAVHDGVVTLTGTVRSWGEKNAIEQAAFHARGVRRIEDRTSVDPYQ